MIVSSGPLGVLHRDLIIALAARHACPRLFAPLLRQPPAVLISYGADSTDQYRRAAGYVDRILKGEKPADLPVQPPTKFRVRHQSQDRQGAWPDVPPTLLARADEVIE